MNGLLAEFYRKWLELHKLRHEKADREYLEIAAQDLLEVHLAIQEKAKNGN